VVLVQVTGATVAEAPNSSDRPPEAAEPDTV
jgi:hypothetical protein